jgi:serralysin
MTRDLNGNTVGTGGNDELWGAALALAGGQIDNGIDDIRGDAGDDLMFGDIYNTGDDGLEGDEIHGGDGNDTIYGDAGTDDPDWATAELGGNDALYGDGGNDKIYGQAGRDVLNGGDGNDTLVGGLGGDFLYGEDGNDALWADLEGATTDPQSLNTMFGGAGNDVLNGGAGVDDLYGDADDDTIHAGGGDDDVEGGDGSDIIHGGDGDDRLEGGGFNADDDGDDVIYGDAGNDEIFGNEGNDDLYGGSGDDLIYGGAGDDRIDGGTGADTYDCDAGNDTYFIDDIGDVFLDEFADTGTDHIYSSLGWTLGDFHERLTLLGGEDIDAAGNAGRNTITGNNGDNHIQGNGGRDFLAGGDGADTFVFLLASDSGKAAAKRDIITDFDRREGDLVDLSAIDANRNRADDQAFSFIGRQDFHGKAGELRFERTGGDTVVYGDLNGDGRADFSLAIDEAIAFKAADFIL